MRINKIQLSEMTILYDNIYIMLQINKIQLFLSLFFIFKILYKNTRKSLVVNRLCD